MTQNFGSHCTKCCTIMDSPNITLIVTSLTQTHNSFHFLSRTVSVDLSTDSVPDIHFLNKPFLTMLALCFCIQLYCARNHKLLFMDPLSTYTFRQLGVFHSPFFPTRTDFLNQTQHLFLLVSNEKELLLSFIIFIPFLLIFKSKPFFWFSLLSMDGGLFGNSKVTFQFLIFLTYKTHTNCQQIS